MQRKRKKRMWDEAPPDVPSGMESALALAQKAKEQAATMTAAVHAANVQTNSATPLTNEELIQQAALAAASAVAARISSQHNNAPQYVKEIKINDNLNRAFLVRATIHQDVFKKTGATITSKGRYFTPGEPWPDILGNSPLSLHITAPTAQSLLQAVKIIEEMSQTAQQVFQDRMFVPVGSNGMATTIAQLRGPNGSYFAHIEQTTGCKLKLQGYGTVTNIQDPLNILIKANSAQQLSHAQQLVSSLITSAQCPPAPVPVYLYPTMQAPAPPQSIFASQPAQSKNIFASQPIYSDTGQDDEEDHLAALESPKAPSPPPRKSKLSSMFMTGMIAPPMSQINQDNVRRKTKRREAPVPSALSELNHTAPSVMQPCADDRPLPAVPTIATCNEHTHGPPSLVDY